MHAYVWRFDKRKVILKIFSAEIFYHEISYFGDLENYAHNSSSRFPAGETIIRTEYYHIYLLR